jgi:hypothetical protein
MPPGMEHSRYYWARYEEQRKRGKTKAYSAGVASIVEKRHKAKLRRGKRR